MGVMSRPRLLLSVAVLCAAAALARCGGSKSGAGAAAPAGPGTTVVAGWNGAPRFVTPGAAPDAGAEVTVEVGRAVTWRFAVTGYNVISGGADGGCVADGLFCSPADVGCTGPVPPQAAGSFYLRTFTAAGDYPYFSEPGCAQGMRGTVHVVVADGGTDGG